MINWFGSLVLQIAMEREEIGIIGWGGIKGKNIDGLG